MSSISISVYGLNFNEHLSNGGTIEFDIADVHGKPAMEHIEEFLNTNKKMYGNMKSKIFKVHMSEEVDEFKDENGVVMFDYIFGSIKSGEYGYSAEIVNAENQNVTHNKGVDEAEVIPFYFMFCFPRVKTNRVLVVLQNNGLYGIKSITEKSLKEYMKNNVGDKIYINMGTMVPETYLERYIQGDINSISLIKWAANKDEADNINSICNSDSVQMVINKPKIQKTFKEKINKFIKGTISLNGIIEIPNFEYDNIKIETKVGKTTKIIDLGNVDKLVFKENIDDQVQTIEGHPEITGMRTICRETACEYLKAMGIL